MVPGDANCANCKQSKFWNPFVASEDLCKGNKWELLVVEVLQNGSSLKVSIRIAEVQKEINDPFSKVKSIAFWVSVRCCSHCFSCHYGNCSLLSQSDLQEQVTLFEF